MKLSIIPLLAVVGLLSMVSCSKEMSYETNSNNNNNNNNNGNTGPADFHATIGGVLWTAAAGMYGATNMDGQIVVSGFSANGNSLAVRIGRATPGTYQCQNSNTTDDIKDINALALNLDDYQTLGTYTTTASDNPDISGGQIILTSIDSVAKTVSGTFSGKVFRQSDSAQVTITDGVFTNIPYATSLPPANSDDTFKVKIAGTEFDAPSISGVTAGGILAVQGETTDATTTVVGITMPQNIVAGSYSLDIMGSTVGLYIHNGVTLGSLQGGTLVILENNTSTKRIRGTFSFTGQDLTGTAPSVELTEGTFAVTYQ